MCFTAFIVHGVPPHCITSVLLLPVIKVKASKLQCMDNYRPIALILTKALERILPTRLEMFVLTTDNESKTLEENMVLMCVYSVKKTQLLCSVLRKFNHIYVF